MARDRLAAIRAQQQANEANQQRQPQSFPRQRGQTRDYDEPRDFDPRGDGDIGGGGYGGRYAEVEEPRYTRGYQPEIRQDYNPNYGQQQDFDPRQQSRSHRSDSQDLLYNAPSSRNDRGRLPSNPRDVSRYQEPPLPATPDFTTPQLAEGYVRPYGSGSSQGEPPQDFDPNAESSFGAGQQRYAEYATPPQQRGQRSQYTPVDPVRTRQRSISGGKSCPDQRDVQRANQISSVGGAGHSSVGGDGRGRFNYPEPGGRRAVAKSGPSYNSDELYDEKASTVNLVDGADEHDQSRRGSGGRKPTKAKGGPTIQRGDVPMEDMSEFFDEISNLQTALREANGSIQQIQGLHMRLLSLPSADDPQAVALTNNLGELTQDTRDFYASIKNRIQALAQGNANLRALIPAGQSMYNLSLEDVDVRQTQVDALKERFKDAIQRYAEVERDNRAKNRAKMERQVKVVNPGLSDGEIKDMVRNAEEGGGNALFSQALLHGQRSHAARGALREVESRAAELARIERTLTELAQLFNDMAVLVEAQDVQIVAIEQNAVQTNQDMEKGLEHTQAAVVSARSSRKMRWWCFGIIMVILLVVVIVVVVEVVVPIVKDRNARNAQNAAPTTVTATATRTVAADAVNTNTNSIPSPSPLTSAPVSASTSAAPRLRRWA